MILPINLGFLLRIGFFILLLSIRRNCCGSGYVVIATGVLLMQVMLSIVIYENANALLLLKNRLGHC